MFFSTIISFAILLLTAAADLHDSCTCHNGDSYNWRMTTVACTTYNAADYQWGGVVYDAPSGRCTQDSTDSQIAGDQWEEACKRVATTGFQCADGRGTCFADPEEVNGSC